MRPLKLVMEAFGSFGKRAEIDFTKTSQNVFLISGNTGSGKTTIFDAIVFALYGEGSSSLDKKEGVMLQSQFANLSATPQVTFSFAKCIQKPGEIYTITRSPRHLRKSRRKGQNVRSVVEGSGRLELTLPDGVTYTERDTQDKIESIVGLTKSQFMQVAMIAQGEFMELFRADAKRKTEIFRKLFNTGIYRQITDELKRRLDESRKELAVCKTECRTLVETIQVPGHYPEKKAYEESRTCLNESLSYLEEYLEQLAYLCSWEEEIQRDMEQGVHTLEQCVRDQKERVGEGNVLTEAFANLEKAQQKQRELLAQKEMWQEQKELIRRLGQVYELYPFYQMAEDARQRFVQLDDSLKKNRKELPDCEAAVSRADEQYESAKHKWEGEQEAFHVAKDNFERFCRLWEEWKASGERMEQYQREYENAQEAARKAYDVFIEMEQCFLNNQAGILAKRLEEGKPCPVCGSCHHPQPSLLPEADTYSQNQVDHARKQADRKREEAQRASELAGRERVHHSGLGNQMRELCRTLFVDAEKYMDQKEVGREFEKKQKAFEKERECFEICERHRNDVMERLEKKRNRIEEETRMREKYMGEWEDKQRQFAERLECADIEMVKLQWYLNKYSEEDYRERKEKLDAYERSMRQCQEAVHAADQLIAGRDIPDLAKLERELGEQSLRLEQQRTELEEMNAYIHPLRHSQKKLQRIQNLHSSTYQENLRLQRLYEIASGTVRGQNKMDVETFVQRYYLSQVLVAANRRFTTMTAGQYELKLKEIKDTGKQRNEGLDFVVHSLITDTFRDIKTLSGGESFMAALSTALGIADCIQSTGGGIHLDMMFIYEGFGSLDEHARNTAIRILKDLAGGQRLIGIISHVAELKESIEDRLVVTKNNEGSFASWDS